MNIKLSLRAIAISSLLTDSKSPEDILEYTTDNVEVVSNACRELLNKGLVTEKSGVYTLVEVPTEAQKATPEPVSELESRVFHLVPKTRIYAIISWFLDELQTLKKFDVTTVDDNQLQKIIDKEYTAAKELKMYTNTELYDLFNIYKKAMDEDSDDKFSVLGLFTIAERRNRRI